MTDICIICNEVLEEDGENISKIGEKGINSLITASKRRNDEKSPQLKDLKSLRVHTSCRKEYTRPDSIKADLRKRVPSAGPSATHTLRSSKPKFDFKTRCLFCASTLKDEKKIRTEKRQTVYSVRNVAFKDSCIEAGRARRDDWGEEVVGHLASVIDLVAAEALYHDECRKSFFRPLYKTQRSSDGPDDTPNYVTEAMNEIYRYMETNSDCQFSIIELRGAVSGQVPNDKTIKVKLLEEFGDRITISPGTNQYNVSTVCFRDTGHKLLRDSWYEAKDSDEINERLRIVKKAAEIIRQDIQSQFYDPATYPPNDDFLKDAHIVPPSLQKFLEEVTMKKTKRVTDTEKKCIAIAHTIISIVRPRTFNSSIMNSLSLLVYRKFGSKTLVNLLANLGFSSSYHEAQLLELSAMTHVKPTFESKSLSQFVFDNADHNVCTIDGLNTFHSMGGIMCVAPSKSLESSHRIPRLTKKPASIECGKLGTIPLQTYQRSVIKNGGLENIKVEHIDVPPQLLEPKPHEMLWFFAKSQGVSVPEWKGYMIATTKGCYSEKTKVLPLPFINAPPSDESTVYTAIQYACQLATENKQSCAIITFDQPLYWKAREIVAAEQSNSMISKCVIRLGGFHLLMSFLGCIGYLMNGSGLKELLSTVFAPLTVDQMLQGHAFARAVRGHLLVQTALSNIVLSQIPVTDEEQTGINVLMQDFLGETPSLDALETNKNLRSIASKFTNELTKLSDQGRTSRLWIQYFQMVSLMKDYINAERSGNWYAHLDSVKRMLPYFHAAGHFPYAKSAQLYIQDMINLSSKMTADEYNRFVNLGYFTMRRSDLFWAGVWSDMTIEMTLMRGFKTNAGVTRGRGTTDSVISKWVVGMSATNDICSSLEQFCGTEFASTEQHVDFGSARQTRNARDVAKIIAWLENHNPFPVMDGIMSLSTGVMGDSSINCHDAVSVGLQAMEKIESTSFAKIKLSRKDRAQPLSLMNSSIKIADEKVPVDPLLLFQRISISKKTDTDLKNYLMYELAPFPLALFNVDGMRKTKKSALYSLFVATSKLCDLPNLDIVIDGGLLIHKVIWPRGGTVAVICEAYITFIKRYYLGKTCTVVFDGYANTVNSTKTAEQQRRYRLKQSADINFDLDTIINVKQEHFLSNSHNKSNFIAILRSQLNSTGIETLQALDDADLMVITTAIEKSKESRVAVIGEDVDLIVLLIARTPPDRDIIFVKPGRGKVLTTCYSTEELQKLYLKDILFLHAFTGCDTTSAAVRRSKVGFCKLYLKSPEIRQAAEMFSKPSSSHADIRKSGNLCFLRWYGAKQEETSLNNYRYLRFLQSVSNVKPDISSLPPTEGAAMEHSFRTYHQVQAWLGQDVSPELWGWKRTESNLLVPVQTKKPAAPEEILKLIFCRCTTDCSSARCGCKKASMLCSTICHNCNGSCTNSINLLQDNGNDDDDGDDEAEVGDCVPSSVNDSTDEEKEEEANAEEPQPGPSRPKKRRVLNDA